MDTVLASLIIITLLIFSILTISNTYLSAQDALVQSWKDMEQRTEARAHTDILVTDVTVSNSGSTLDVTLDNRGNEKLAAFEDWDVIVQYYTLSGTYVIGRLSYVASGPLAANTWTVAGIYEDASQSITEVFEPNILNPGEQGVIEAEISPSMGLGTSALVVITTPNGIRASQVYTY